MFATVCPVCNNKFYSENDNFEKSSALHRYCVKGNETGDQQNNHMVRTSTPIAELENSPLPSFSDSVTDFFYQSWKSGLHSSDNMADQMLNIRQQHQLHAFMQFQQQPMCFNPQVVYINTVIYQSFPMCTYTPRVGYRPDGTFGVLPSHWGYQ